MKIFLLISLLVSASICSAQAPPENYPVDSASIERIGVPKGELIKCVFENSTIFPGTWREYWIYVPAQYNPSKPACVYVGQDGIMLKAPTVFDNLIHNKEIPVTIGVFINPGRVLALNANSSLDRFNRSFEYDGLGDNYAHFILEEIFPDVEKHQTADGRKILLSKDGNDRAIGGNSSGAIAAFTAAWEKPSEFSRVFSAIGTYVGLRGGNVYSTLIRKTEPKPIRMFLQDGSNDNNSAGGDWWKANESMERSLKFSGYEVNHIWGEGSHNAKHATAIFPEAMRWLWKNYPARVVSGKTANPMLTSILIPNEDWVLKQVSQVERSKEIKLTSYSGFTYTIENDKLYFSDKAGKKKLIDGDLNQAKDIAFTPDQSQLYLVNSSTHWVWIYQIQPDGTLKHKQRFGWLHVPDVADNASAKSIICDQEGRIYVATNMGVQVLDQPGRVNAILPLPEGIPERIWFEGRDLNILHAFSNGNVFTRKLNVSAALPSKKPVLPVKPKL